MGTRFTSDIKDPAINVTAWCLLVVIIPSVCTRMGNKYRLFHGLDIDDFLIVTSLVFLVCIAQVRPLLAEKIGAVSRSRSDNFCIFGSGIRLWQPSRRDIQS